MVAKSKQVYTGHLNYNDTSMGNGDPHKQVNGADLWTPQGDITIIGAVVKPVCNPLPNTDIKIEGGTYSYCELSLVARENEERASIVRAELSIFPLEMPTIGEHDLWGSHRHVVQQIMFPEGYGIDLDRWHPVYLNCGFRAFFGAGGFELGGAGTIWYVERG